MNGMLLLLLSETLPVSKIQMEMKTKEEKILKIIEKEFAVSLSQKDAELSLIDQRILEVRKCLNLVRTGAVISYYTPTQTKQSLNNDHLELHQTPVDPSELLHGLHHHLFVESFKC